MLKNASSQLCFRLKKKKKKETRMTASVLWPEEGNFPENVHRDVYVMIYKRSFESFTCLDLLYVNCFGRTMHYMCI